MTASECLNPTEGGQFRLFTHWGTVVYYDVQRNEVRHGPAHQHQGNVLFLACGTRQKASSGAVLVSITPDRPALVSCNAESSVPTPWRDAATIFDFSISDLDKLALKANGLFLCAEQDGGITLSRQECSAWETFTIASGKPWHRADLAATSGEVADVVARIRNEHPVDEGQYISRRKGGGRNAVITDARWIEGYVTREHYHFVQLLHETWGFDIVDSRKSDFFHEKTIRSLNEYDTILLAWQGHVEIPLNLLDPRTIFRIDDLRSFDQSFDELTGLFSRYSEMVISPYAYELGKYFPHSDIEWVPYSTAVEEECGHPALNDDPIRKILLSGSVAWDRPFRQYVFGLDDERLVKLGHPGYHSNYRPDSQEMVGARWFRELNKYIAGFCDAHSLRYIHLRAFEVASVGSLLLADRLVEREMNELGFVDGETCVFCDQDDFLQKVEWVLDDANRAQVDAIRAAGMKLCLERHTTRQRVADFVVMLRARGVTG